MSDFPPVRAQAQLEANRFRSGVSESLMQVYAGSTNFQNYFNYQKFDFKLFGFYNAVATPFYFDGLDIFEFNSAIIDVWAWCEYGGSSGTTTFDVQIETSPGSGWTSIFTTQPSIAYNATGASDGCWVGVVNAGLVGPEYFPPTYTAPANTVRPVLSSVANSITAWTGIRALLTSVQGGQPKDCGIMIRARNI